MRTAFIPWVLVTLVHLVSCCEMETHYMKDEKCCKMCGPGKRMLVDDNCEDPRCQDCQDGEYQSGFTIKTTCERQPSCDPNLHFLPQNKPSKTELSKCQCEIGYYCTQSDDCDTCIKHTVCKPGQRVFKKGASFSDTVCKPCENGTFSTSDSSDTCMKWSECESGYYQKTPGNSTSDRTCVAGTNIYIILLGVGVFLIIVAIVVFVFIKKRKSGCYKFPKKTIEVLTHGEPEDVEKAYQPLNQQPQEDIDHSVPVSPTLSNLTDNGNFVAQEDGKPTITPTTESNSFL